ncbi:hypothetical protein BC833DRAFT_573436 [Globomyces pollinis-pini]|nr:hypothetical protein BC833DRAFT_573436 [Globomyces pollinis-pini]
MESKHDLLTLLQNAHELDFKEFHSIQNQSKTQNNELDTLMEQLEAKLIGLQNTLLTLPEISKSDSEMKAHQIESSVQNTSKRTRIPRLKRVKTKDRNTNGSSVLQSVKESHNSCAMLDLTSTITTLVDPKRTAVPTRDQTVNIDMNQTNCNTGMSPTDDSMPMLKRLQAENKTLKSIAIQSARDNEMKALDSVSNSLKTLVNTFDQSNSSKQWNDLRKYIEFVNEIVTRQRNGFENKLVVLASLSSLSQQDYFHQNQLLESVRNENILLRAELENISTQYNEIYIVFQGELSRLKSSFKLNKFEQESIMDQKNTAHSTEKQGSYQNHSILNQFSNIKSLYNLYITHLKEETVGIPKPNATIQTPSNQYSPVSETLEVNSDMGVPIKSTVLLGSQTFGMQQTREPEENLKPVTISESENRKYSSPHFPKKPTRLRNSSGSSKQNLMHSLDQITEEKPLVNSGPIQTKQKVTNGQEVAIHRKHPTDTLTLGKTTALGHHRSKSVNSVLPNVTRKSLEKPPLHFEQEQSKFQNSDRKILQDMELILNQIKILINKSTSSNDVIENINNYVSNECATQPAHFLQIQSGIQTLLEAYDERFPLKSAFQKQINRSTSPIPISIDSAKVPLVDISPHVAPYKSTLNLVKQGDLSTSLLKHFSATLGRFSSMIFCGKVGIYNDTQRKILLETLGQTKPLKVELTSESLEDLKSQSTIIISLLNKQKTNYLILLQDRKSAAFKSSNNNDQIKFVASELPIETKVVPNNVKNSTQNVLDRQRAYSRTILNSEPTKYNAISPSEEIKIEIKKLNTQNVKNENQIANLQNNLQKKELELTNKIVKRDEFEQSKHFTKYSENIQMIENDFREREKEYKQQLLLSKQMEADLSKEIKSLKNDLQYLQAKLTSQLTKGSVLGSVASNTTTPRNLTTSAEKESKIIASTSHQLREPDTSDAAFKLAQAIDCLEQIAKSKHIANPSLLEFEELLELCTSYSRRSSNECIDITGLPNTGSEVITLSAQKKDQMSITMDKLKEKLKRYKEALLKYQKYYEINHSKLKSLKEKQLWHEQNLQSILMINEDETKELMNLIAERDLSLHEYPKIILAMIKTHKEILENNYNLHKEKGDNDGQINEFGKTPQSMRISYPPNSKIVNLTCKLEQSKKHRECLIYQKNFLKSQIDLIFKNLIKHSVKRESMNVQDVVKLIKDFHAPLPARSLIQRFRIKVFVVMAVLKFKVKRPINS